MSVHLGGASFDASVAPPKAICHSASSLKSNLVFNWSAIPASVITASLGIVDHQNITPLGGISLSQSAVQVGNRVRDDI